MKVVIARPKDCALLEVEPIESSFCLKDKIYINLKKAITSMNLYEDTNDLRLDERHLSAQLNISRTPVREALARLQQEGLVEIIPRRGVYIIRKTKVEILEMITVWAALESMAARLITLNASDAEIASLRHLVETFESDQIMAKLDEYSENNINFHQKILSLSKNKVITNLSENLFIHLRSIRSKTIGEDGRFSKSIVDHIDIVEAIEKRQTELAEKLVREHTLNLATHVEKYVNYIS